MYKFVLKLSKLYKCYLLIIKLYKDISAKTVLPYPLVVLLDWFDVKSLCNWLKRKKNCKAIG